MQFMLVFCGFFVNLINYSSAIVGGQKSALPPFDDPVVFVNYLGRFARVEGHHDRLTGLYTFRGIKYAEPPINENRFLRPQYKRLVGDVNATRNPPPCPQPDYYDERKIIGNEDCLALNIFTPQMPDESTGLPVMLWIHGGGWRYGSASQFGAEPIIQNKVIFVPIQFRLGTLGILGDGTKEFGGNVALFDINSALRWVKEYISFFGGDPNQIKVVGHGSGAAGAMYVSQTPQGRSSLNGVVAMSGSSMDQYSHDDNTTNSVVEVAKNNNCANANANETELIKCLRAKSIEDIVLQDNNIQTERLHERNMIKAMSGMASFAPSVETMNDERGLPGMIVDKPENTIKKEPDIKIPILIGVTKHETANGINPKEIDKIFKTATDFLKSVSGTLKIAKIWNETLATGTGVLQNLGLPNLNEYLTIPSGMDPEKILSKLIEATTDVFFNFPSVMTADLWGKWSSAFFYQFEHAGDVQPSGKQFLRPLPLVSKSSTKGLVAHGDELGYLFNVYDIFGNRIPGSEIKTDNDMKARKNFIDLIVNFAYLNSTQSQFKLNNQIIAPFRAENSVFMKISNTFSIEKDFRFCQLALWGAPLKASQKMSCEFLKDGLKKILNTPKDITKVLGNIG